MRARPPKRSPPATADLRELGASVALPAPAPLPAHGPLFAATRPRRATSPCSRAPPATSGPTPRSGARSRAHRRRRRGQYHTGARHDDGAHPHRHRVRRRRGGAGRSPARRRRGPRGHPARPHRHPARRPGAVRRGSSHEQLAAAGIPSNGPSVVPLAGRVAGRALLGLLALPERGFRRQDVFALARAPRRSCAAAPGRRCVAWERLSREAGVVAGRARLGRAARTLRRRPRRDDRQRRPRLGRRRLAGRTARAQQSTAPATCATSSSGSSTTSRRAAGSPRRLGRARALGPRTARPRSSAAPAGATRWPADERKAAERVEAALDRLAALDAVEGPVELDVFAADARARAGERPRSRRPLRRRRARRPDRDGGRARSRSRRRARPRRGHLPRAGPRRLAAPRPRAGGRGRRAPAAAGASRPRAPRAAGRAGGRDARSCSACPRGDLRRSTERVPSRWVLDIASALAGEPLVDRRAAAPRRPAGSSRSRRSTRACARLDFPATEQEHRLRTLLVGAARERGRARVVERRRGPGRRRRSWSRASQLGVHPLRRQPRRAHGAVAGRRGHLGDPPAGVGHLPVRLLRRGRSRRPAGRESRGDCRSARSTGARWSTRRWSGSSSGSSASDQPVPDAMDGEAARAMLEIGGEALRRVRGARRHRAIDLLGS